jgi:hypothetical protein
LPAVLRFVQSRRQSPANECALARRVRPRRARTCLGKDANLISSSKLKSKYRRARAPQPNRCARAARRIVLLLATCVFELAICNLVQAQPAATSVYTRLPAVEPQPIQTAQLLPTPMLPQTVPAVQPSAPPRSSFRKIMIQPRSEGLGPQGESVQTPTGEHVVVVSGGVNIIIQGLSGDSLPQTLGPLGDIDIEADRVVVWGVDTSGGLNGATQQSNDPLEIYMEGNIIFRQGDRTVYADRMFYDVKRQIGTILNAELLTTVPQAGNYQYPGLVRLRAAALRQLDAAHFQAKEGMFTTSRIEEPSYSLESEDVTFEDLQEPTVDPITGAPAVGHQRLVHGSNNYLYVGEVPVFYWPTLSTDLEKPTYYIDNFRFRHDNIFGYQAMFELDAFQVFGIDRPKGVKWNLDLDYLSERGFGYGTNAVYTTDSFFSIAGPTTGRADLWFISDHGFDNLGQDRRKIDPEEDFRGKIDWKQRQHIAGGLLDNWTVQTEVGWLSDRTFLEEYYEDEWDNNKDLTTGVRLKRTFDNQSVSIEANAQINDFFTQTQWLPRLDHYWLGQSLLGDNLTWFEHSSAAYANIGVANPIPLAPPGFDTNPFARLPWEDDSNGNPISGNGERLITRQEIDWPIDAAPFKIVPYGLGELGDWGQDVNGERFQRAMGQAGVRASIPFWYADPNIHDQLFNINGLAHKVIFDVQASVTGANQDLTRLPLYDELDDDSIEDFRRRLFFSPFGGTLAGTYYIPGTPGVPSTINPKFDPRFYALRYGLADFVTSPSDEIADDLIAIRTGMHHRLQTKRGAPGEEHIVDWITFDANATIFPKADRDDAGSAVGMLDYDFRWNIGDRTSILSDGYADTFGDGLRTASIGMLINRPARGNFYLGFRAADGLFVADVVSATINYRMTDKWIGSSTSSIDFGPTHYTGETFGFTRVGESLLTTLGASVDTSKGTVGVHFLVEPRFLPKLQTTSKTGIEIAPAGAYGLE